MNGGSSSGAEPTSQEPRYQPLVIVAAAVCAGILTDRFVPLPLVVWWLAALSAWIAWLVLWCRKRDLSAARLLLLAVAACSGSWHHCRWNLFAASDLGFFAARDQQPIGVEVVALGGPRRVPAPKPNPMRIIPLGDRTWLDVSVVGIRDGDAWRPASGQARLLVDGHLLGVHAGDRLRVFAQLTAPEPPHNPGEFDFAAHARADRNRGLLRAHFPDCVTCLAPAGLLNPRRWIDAARTTGDRLLTENLGRHAGLASALLLGLREEVAEEQTEAFLETGTIHVLSISGLHVGILAGVLFFLVRMTMLPRVPAAILVGATTVFYTLVTDAQPPAVRAMILVLVMCVAYALGRRALGINSLAAAALVVLALNPADLFRVGVQLSFLCVLGLSWFGGLQSSHDENQAALQKLIGESRPWPLRTALRGWAWFWHMTVLGAAIWLLTLPLVMARFHLLSPVALILNTLLWLPMLLVLWSGFSVLVLGMLLPPVATVGGWCCEKSLEVLQWSIEAARSWPGSYFWVAGPADWWLAGFYGGVALAAAFPQRRPPRRWCVAIVAGWIAIGFLPGFWQAFAASRAERLECTFLSMDHGCAVVIRLPSGATMLYDAGKFGSPESGAQSIAASLWSMGVSHLDAVVLSHADADHYNSLPGLLHRFSVGAVYVSPMMFEQDEPGLEALRTAIERAGVPIREIAAGDRLQGGMECKIEVIHPTRRGVHGNDNANSLVLALEYGGRRVLLPGDLERPGLNHVLAEEPLLCDVLLAPHHGSRGSDPPGLAVWCRPHWVVISGGRRIDLRQTQAAYEGIGAEILHTGSLGAICATIEREGVTIDRLLPER